MTQAKRAEYFREFLAESGRGNLSVRQRKIIKEIVRISEIYESIWDIAHEIPKCARGKNSHYETFHRVLDYLDSANALLRSYVGLDVGISKLTLSRKYKKKGATDGA